MAITSLSFSAALPTYTSIGSHGTAFAGNSLTTSGTLAINTDGNTTVSGKASVLTSTLKSNGLTYTPRSSSINGNLITVIYGLSDSATADKTFQASDQAKALAGTPYGLGIGITATGSKNTDTSTLTAYRLATKGAFENVTSGFANTQEGFSASTGSDGSTLSLHSISAVGNDLQVVYQLSDAPAASDTTDDASADASSADNPGIGANFSKKGLETIGDLLASLSGLSFTGSLGGALQAQTINQFTGPAHSAAILAGALSPASSGSFQIGDFINTSTDSFPSAGTSLPASDNGSSTQTTSTGIYNAVASLGTSTIRGAGLDLEA